MSGSLYAPHAPGGRVCPRLCTLDLSGNVVGRVGCAALGTAMCKEGGLEGLHSLRLSGAKNVGDEGAKYLLRALTGAQAALGGVGLRQLDLSYCGLGARGMAEVGMAMVAQALPRLQELSLAGNDDKDHEVEEVQSPRSHTSTQGRGRELGAIECPMCVVQTLLLDLCVFTRALPNP